MPKDKLYKAIAKKMEESPITKPILKKKKKKKRKVYASLDEMKKAANSMGGK